jgi:hypothetical protein
MEAQIRHQQNLDQNMKAVTAPSAQEIGRWDEEDDPDGVMIAELEPMDALDDVVADKYSRQ